MRGEVLVPILDLGPVPSMAKCIDSLDDSMLFLRDFHLAISPIGLTQSQKMP
jgi:hypothetical protein